MTESLKRAGATPRKKLTEASMPLHDGEILLKKYKVLGLLGSGALGDVYLAEDVDLKRKVAVKHLKLEYAADEETLERFRREARTIANLRHPNIAIVHGLEQEDGQAYVIMEYAEEGTLADFLAEKSPLPITQAIDLAIALSRALAAVHRRGIFHRDIKPSNILLIQSEDIIAPKLADFGLSSAPRSGALFGTLQYAAPEQLWEESVDARSDIYSLGMTMYEMLTGKPPFVGSAEEVIRAQLEKQPPSPKSARKEIPPSLERVVLKALSKKPEDRYQTAQEMAEDLERARQEELAKEEQVRNLYAQAEQYIREQNWPRVIETLEALSSLNPDYEGTAQSLEEAQKQWTLETTYEQGSAALSQGDWDEAKEKFAQILDIDATYRDVADKLKEAKKQVHLLSIYTEARQFEDMGEWSEAIQKYAQIIATDSGYKDAAQRLAKAGERNRLQLLYDQANALFAEKNWQEAVEKFQEVLALDPQYKDAASKAQEAEKHAQSQILYIRDKRLQLLYDEACLLFAEKNWEEAAEKFQRVLALDPQYEDVASKLEEAQKHARLQMLYIQGIEYLENGEWDRAIATLRKVQRSDPGYGAVDARLAEAERQKRLQDLYDEGLACRGRMDWQGAIEKFTQLLSENPEHPTAGMLLEEAKRRQAQEKTKVKRSKENAIKKWWASQHPGVKAACIGAAATLLVALCGLLGGDTTLEMARYLFGMNLTPTPIALPAPVILQPENEAHLVGEASLKWQWSGTLEEDEYFSVRVWKEEEPEGCFHAQMKSTEYAGELAGCSDGKYYWQAVVARKISDNPLEWEEISQSEVRSFYFSPR